MQLWEFGAEYFTKNRVRKCSLGAPHLCLGSALSSGPVPCWSGPWPTDLISCLTSDLPCLNEVALVMMDLPGNDCSAAWSRLFVTSPATFLKGAPLLMRLVLRPRCHPWLTSLWGEAHSFWQMGPQLFWKFYLRKQYYRVLKSQPFNRNRCWLCTLYHKISSKAWFTIVLLIFCTNQETFLNKLVIQQNALSGIYMSSRVPL